MGLNSNVSETLAIFERALEQHDTILGTKYLNNVLKIKLFFISLWDIWRIKFSQSHSLKRLSCSVASGRPNCFTWCWTCTIINVFFRISFVCKMKGWSSPSSLNNTKMHSRKFLTIIPSIIDHKLWITSSTFKSSHKKKNSISIKAQILIIKLKKKNKYRHFKLRFESPQKHKQDSLNIKPKTHNHLSLTKAQECNCFVY